MPPKRYIDLSAKQRKRIAARQIQEEEESSSSNEEAMSYGSPSEEEMFNEPAVTTSSDTLSASSSSNLHHSVSASEVPDSMLAYSNPNEPDSEYDSDDLEPLFSEDEEDAMISDEDEEEESTVLFRDFCKRHLPADSAVDELLKILHMMRTTDALPKSHKELYNTPDVPMMSPVAIGGGEYLHFGIENNLRFIEDLQLDELTLNFSWDGVRLFKSSKINMWPIVMTVEEYKTDAMLVGLFIGETKPSNPNEFFHSFNDEAKTIHQTGVNIGNRRVRVRGNYFTSDVPAKTWALCKLYNM